MGDDEEESGGWGGGGKVSGGGGEEEGEGGWWWKTGKRGLEGGGLGRRRGRATLSAIFRHYGASWGFMRFII